MFASLGDMFVQQRLHSVGAQPAAVHVRKESRCGLGRSPSQLTLRDLNAPFIGAFLEDLETLRS